MMPAPLIFGGNMCNYQAEIRKKEKSKKYHPLTDVLNLNLRLIRLVHQYKKCSICHLPIFSISECNIDHHVPRSKGGVNSLKNLRPSHKICNTLKGNTMPKRLDSCEIRKKFLDKTHTDFFTALNKNRKQKLTPDRFIRRHIKKQSKCSICLCVVKDPNTAVLNIHYGHKFRGSFSINNTSVLHEGCLSFYSIFGG